MTEPKRTVFRTPRVPRRRFLAMSGMSIAGVALLAACGEDGDPPPAAAPASTSAATPVTAATPAPATPAAEDEPEAGQVLDQGGQRSDPYAGYYRDRGSTGVLGVEHRDERLETKEFVLSVQPADQPPKAYPYRWLNDEPVVNDRLGTLDIVVAFDAETGTADAFRREVGGRTLTFEAPPGGRGNRFIDRETGSTWSLVSGRALDGPLVGAQLARVNAIPIFWFAWVDSFPQAAVWEP